MNSIKSNISGLKVIKLKPNYDNRGVFVESFVKKKYSFLKKINFKQDNYSISKKNVLRGLHYQLKNAQDKLIHVTSGKLLNYTIDIRINSPTYLNTFSIILSFDNFNQIFIPKGCANGILSLSNNLILNYKCSDYYNPNSSFGIRWNDPFFNLQWGIKKPIVSEIDNQLPNFIDIPKARLPKF